MALPDVVQQVLHAMGDALALGLQRQALSLGVERQVVAGRGRVHPLLNRKSDALSGLLVALHLVGHLHQRACIEQVHLGDEGRLGIV